MKTVSLFLLLITPVSLGAQKVEQFYDWQWQRCEPANARFITILEKKDALWERKDYFLRERRLHRSGFFTDTFFKVQQGNCFYYHPNGVPSSHGNYFNGQKEGLWLSFYPDGSMSDSAVFTGGRVTGTRFTYHKNGFLSDSIIYNPDGSGVEVSWFEDGSPSSAGRYGPGRRKQGKWQYFHRNGKLSALEVYEDNRLLSKQHYNEEGHHLSDSLKPDRPAMFMGMKGDWQRYLQKQLYFPSRYKIVNGDQAVVVVNGVIDEEGKMTAVEVHTPFHPQFDQIAVMAMKNSPKWMPAISHNRRVKFSIRQTITFHQQSD
ncbi:hypothetical protein EXU57_14105 [Segetibacter sp. 3557_3]|uniref:energy transducer TonB n=1 Tax=Segetibacter sp. 3557_3 TaxID=2547429 RepID=UPI0010589554|nr:energy transducer TonB [Segetibacter sp. 3557_3]TDH25234.1 hypothetical protein EXU57_14105 [Segetibacter sp. 3557_3]